jgi:hypothetical protein
MGTDETIYSLNRQLSDGCQAPLLTELYKSTENRSNEISVGEPGRSGNIIHHWSCCCAGCWKAKFR